MVVSTECGQFGQRHRGGKRSQKRFARGTFWYVTQVRMGWSKSRTATKIFPVLVGFKAWPTGFGTGTERATSCPSDPRIHWFELLALFAAQVAVPELERQRIGRGEPLDMTKTAKTIRVERVDPPVPPAYVLVS